MPKKAVTKKPEKDLMENIVSLAKRRGFVFADSEIYGGLANSWDFGPLGAVLKHNIKNRWWHTFVSSRGDMVGMDSALIMNPKIWEAAGHVGNFSDPLVECKQCHTRFRADMLVNDGALQKASMDFSGWTTEEKEKFVKKNFPPCPQCGAKEKWSMPQMFNLMFKTFVGPSEDKSNAVYLRPETAQGIFVNFKNVVQTTRKRLPFGIAQMGKAFRNEITPGNFIFRMREFEQMEIEYFVKEKEWEKYFEMWLALMKEWLKDLGISAKKLHFTEIEPEDRAHYSKRTIDVEYDYPFGKKELYGLAYRGDFDLKSHMDVSGEDLTYLDPDTGEKFLPHVIEPSLGVERSVLAAMLEAYHEEKVSSVKHQASSEEKEDKEEDTRVVMKFPKWLAPVKVAVLPLSKHEKLAPRAKEIFDTLLQHFACEYDETQSIGKRYRRQDEIGTPYCVTVDFDSLEDNAVTVRDRDTMKQERVKIGELQDYLTKKLK